MNTALVALLALLAAATIAVAIWTAHQPAPAPVPCRRPRPACTFTHFAPRTRRAHRHARCRA